MPRIGFSASVPGEGEGLAGVPAADEVGSFNGAPIDLRDIAEVGDVGPVLVQDTAGVAVDLGLPDDPHSGPLESEVEPADAGEQGADGEGH
jgi:hypothetical protein